LSKSNANTIFHGIEHWNPSFEKIYVQKLTKIPFEEGQVQDPIPALPGHRSKIPAVRLGDICGAEMRK
jgi:hypothetical protein